MLDRVGWLLAGLQSAASRFGWAYGYRGSLFLIAGGVFVLGVLVVLLMVQSTLFGVPPRRALAASPSVLVAPPAPPPPLAADAAGALAREGAEKAYRLGTLAGAAVSPGTLDGALDRFVQAGLGDPRVVATGSRRKLLRVAACRTCHALAAAPGGCAYERGFLEGALGQLAPDGVKVRETACRARGDASCDFEVVY